MAEAATFRRVGAGDVEALLPLLRAYWQYDGIRYRDAEVRRGLQQLLDRPALGGAWLIEGGGAPIGYFILTWGFDLEFGGRHAWLTDLWLEPAWRGRGLGRQVFALVDELLLAEGASFVELVVERDNLEAQAFYKKLGFEAADRVPLARRLKEPDDAT